MHSYRIVNDVLNFIWFANVGEALLAIFPSRFDQQIAGVNHSFEVLGRKETAEQAFAMLAPGGTATIVGMIPFGQKIELHGFDFLRERKIQGSSMGSNHFRVDMPRLIEFYMRGKLHLEDWISAKLKLSEINDGFAAMKAGKTVRSVIMFDA